MKRSPWRALAAGGIVATAFAFIALVFAVALGKANPGEKDFIEYWAAEQALVHYAQPYDPATILGIERSGGFPLARPEFWYSPPPALLFGLPLGFVGAQAGLVLWTLFQFTLLSVALWLLWRLDGRPDTLVHLLGFLFAPALLCLEAGQISLFFLLGMVLFLTFVRTRPLVAGVALFPCVLKPHLFLPFALVLLLWIVTRRAYAILAGFSVALGAAWLVILPFDPRAWHQYADLMHRGDMMNEYIATLSVSLRFLVDRRAVWIGFVPAAMASLWAARYFWRRRAHWDWMDEGLLVLAVSAMCAPYGWFFDESVLLPVVLAALLRARAAGRPLWPLGLAAGVAFLEVQQAVNVMSPYYLWTTPAWLGCYLYAARPGRHRAEADLGQREAATGAAGNR